MSFFATDRVADWSGTTIAVMTQLNLGPEEAWSAYNYHSRLCHYLSNPSRHQTFSVRPIWRVNRWKNTQLAMAPRRIKEEEQDISE
jgi:hypothetical protein